MYKKKIIRSAIIASFIMFVLWTVLVGTVDRKPIAPDGSLVGFARINMIVHDCIGVHMNLYQLTDWLGIIPFACVAALGMFGLFQWIKRKNIRRVDRSLLALGGVYMLVAAVYVFFEYVVINYRPVLIGGIAEASYPSSTTMLVLCVMPTALMRLSTYISSPVFRRVLTVVVCLFLVFMVVMRLVSGVHWFSDIIGGIIFSVFIVLLYYSVICDS